MELFQDGKYSVFAEVDLWRYKAPFVPEQRKEFVHLTSSKKDTEPTFRRGGLIGAALSDNKHFVSTDPFGYNFVESGSGVRYAVKEHDVSVSKVGV
jgi:hypothetical protein